MSGIEIFFLIGAILAVIIGVLGTVEAIRSKIKYDVEPISFGMHYPPVFRAICFGFVGLVGIVGIIISITGGFSDFNVGTTPNGKIYFYHEDASYSYPEEIEYMGKTYILATETVEVTEEA